MNVIINNKSIELFKGATLKHALLKTDPSLYEKVLSGEAVIEDQHGNLTQINGAVGENFSYTVVKK
ncbi:hypothetical protein [Sutcliffiella rhizosphaerae]|uniref:Uncharacterized protein n=1 Tax=Sutcliffiella rhizosphaerae TaxID=2880967 RepID=A0ABM8YLU6_9BACI|nr:hypothetical protein [Sutcliffiella rhizosphaerae]CAG9620802.1 hypothetical protein BACCIP111883_01573 [Sutcliffiella rhizosphaerae]